MRRSLHAVGVIGLVLAVLGVTAPPAAAAPPNDSRRNAIKLTIPERYTQDTTGADGNGPRFCSNNTSVFFKFKLPATARVQVDTFGSDYDTVLGVFTRDGGIDPIRCNDDRFDLTSGVRFRARAETTYYIMVAQCCGNGDSYGGGNLVLSTSFVSADPLVADLEVLEGSYDPVSGSATIAGTMTCTIPAFFWFEGILRQVRDGLYLARGSSSGYGLLCAPGGPTWWEVEVDSETSYAFGAGDSRLTYWAGAGDGFKRWVEIADREKVMIELQAL